MSETKTPLVSIIIPSYNMAALAFCTVARENLRTYLTAIFLKKDWTVIVSR